MSINLTFDEVGLSLYLMGEAEGGGGGSIPPIFICENNGKGKSFLCEVKYGQIT